MFVVSMQQILRTHHLSLELVKVVTRAVDWPAEKENVRYKKIKKKTKRTNASCLLVHNLNSRIDCRFS